jgi:dihydrofolate reductase
LTDYNLIVAVDQRGGYSARGEIPWSFQSDWDWFKTRTAGSYCIMGRRTAEDIINRKTRRLTSKLETSAESELPPAKNIIEIPEGPLLSERESIVISSKETRFAGAEVYPGLREAVERGCKHRKMPIFILGGLRLWIQAWPEVKTVYQTIIHADYDCDKFFPIHLLNQDFELVKGEKTEEGGQELMFTTWQRKQKKSTRR